MDGIHTARVVQFCLIVLVQAFFFVVYVNGEQFLTFICLLKHNATFYAQLQAVLMHVM